jgi:hypothetical protein
MMTGLVFVLQRDGVMVGMDSLACYPSDKSPFKYCSKILSLPHLSAAICPTGTLQLGLDWYVDVQSNILARDLDFVNGIAPERLREIYARLPEPPGTSTVYHFGYSPKEDAFVGVAFRSTNNFVAEVIPYGVGIKPAFDHLVSIAADEVNALGYADGIVSMLHHLRLADDALPMVDRVGIGGEVHLLTLTASRQTLHVVDRWPDFDDQFRQMMHALGTPSAEAASDGAGGGNVQQN